jgi:hypothetical protein
MGKRTQKLLVYLDQNFLSEMAKAGINEKVRPEFKEIYELLHLGFVDEKLVVPGSVLHDVHAPPRRIPRAGSARRQLPR